MGRRATGAATSLQALPARPSTPPPADVFNKFAASSWGQKLAKQQAKAATTDFDRYKATVAKIKRSAQVGGAVGGGTMHGCGVGQREFWWGWLQQH